MIPPIKTAVASDTDQIVDSIVLAFVADPAVRWMYPNPQQYLKHFPEFVRTFGSKAFQAGTVDYVDGYAGAALWFPPGIYPDEEALVGLLQRTVAEQDQETIFAVFEQMGDYHPPEPHWYLPLIGVESAKQGNGYGSALLKSALARCDRDQKPAYLESSNPANIPLYERHGFEAIGRIQVETSPAIVPMIRYSR